MEGGGHAWASRSTGEKGALKCEQRHLWVRSRGGTTGGAGTG